MPRSTTKAQVKAKIAADADAARAADEKRYLTRDRVRKELQFLKDFPPDTYDLPCIEPRCKLCKAITPDQELRREINRRLLAGDNHQVLIERLAEAGIRATPANLSIHYRKHVLPYVMDIVRHRATTSVFVDAARKLGQDGSIAEIMVTSLLLKLQPIVEGLDPAEIALLAPDRQIDLLLKATKALADIQALEAGAKLRAVELALKRASLNNAERQAMARATAAIRDILKGHPDLWGQLQPILAPLAQEAGQGQSQGQTQDAPALPEARQ